MRTNRRANFTSAEETARRRFCGRLRLRRDLLDLFHRCRRLLSSAKDLCARGSHLARCLLRWCWRTHPLCAKRGLLPRKHLTVT